MTDTATVEPGSASTGLLDNVTLQDDTKPETKEAVAIDHKTPQESTAAASETGAPKVKPEYLPDNFWNADKGEANLEAMAKSWTDLRKQISQGKHKPPEDGKYDTASWGEDAAENPMANTILGWAKDNQLSQAQFDDLVGKLKTQAQELMDSQAIDPAKELAALGPNATAIVGGMTDWARGLVQKGIWSADDFEEFKIMGGTARGLNALLKLRETYEGRIPIEAAPLEGAPSKDELYAMVADKRYGTDPAYRQKVEKMFQQFVR